MIRQITNIKLIFLHNKLQSRNQILCKQLCSFCQLRSSTSKFEFRKCDVYPLWHFLRQFHLFCTTVGVLKSGYFADETQRYGFDISVFCRHRVIFVAILCNLLPDLRFEVTLFMGERYFVAIYRVCLTKCISV